MSNEEKLEAELEEVKKTNSEILAKMAKIETALIGNEEYKIEGLITTVKRHDELFIKMSHLGRFTLSMLGIGAAVGTAITWVIHNVETIVKLFKGQ